MTPRDAAAGDTRQALELAQTAQARFETTKAAAERYGFDLTRAVDCAERILDRVHRGPCQDQVMWVLEIALGMLTAVMAVNREQLPVVDQVDPASYAMASLRDIATAAAVQDLSWECLEREAVACLQAADENGYAHLETYWALNRATAACELAWARSLASAGD